MSKFLKTAALIGLLVISSACGKKKFGMSGAKKATQEVQKEVSHMGLDSYCYCPAKHGTVGVVHFDFDKSEVLPEAQRLIDTGISKCVAERLKEDHNIKVLVTGYCDKRGTQEYNIALGSRRAHSTKSYLADAIREKDNDVDLDGRLCINSRGKEDLVDHADSEEAHAKNRRAVIEFVEECK